LTVDGFLFVTGTGVSSDTLERNLAIAQHAISGISNEEKLPYAAQLDKGSYVGYKLRGIWQQQGGVTDNIEVRLDDARRIALTISTTTSNRTLLRMSSRNIRQSSCPSSPRSAHSPNTRITTSFTGS
jgi:hypothetical protein